MAEGFTIIVRVQVTSGAEVWSALGELERLVRYVTAGELAKPTRWRAGDGRRQVNHDDLSALRDSLQQHPLDPTSIEVSIRRRAPAASWVLRGWIYEKTSAFEASAQMTGLDRAEVERLSRRLAVELERGGSLPAIGRLRASAIADDHDAPDADHAPRSSEGVLTTDGMPVGEEPEAEPMTTPSEGASAPAGRERRTFGRFIADHSTALSVTVVGCVTVIAIALWLGLIPF
ncbi:hypothetical protein NQ152_03365 [Microbacterium sp. zg.B48]|uniref:hypothetical protein n=1 Tax=unclassified Microbacterium TaxID=2609290 RepID=UPI00214C0EF1|nr:MULTISPECIES: hypothetical protein [unclassified Microbacterium]MCR2762544.1 hypothetical protein [Microbacterium sp. zg.B48]MCR2810714.1 hypothetical protein [Microbacterium sp. zg.B185]WIM18250.1 hypothetical protein QNO12_11610 [Microbacterium sp. zg-B185]